MPCTRSTATESATRSAPRRRRSRTRDTSLPPTASPLDPQLLCHAPSLGCSEYTPRAVFLRPFADFFIAAVDCRRRATARLREPARPDLQPQLARRALDARRVLRRVHEVGEVAEVAHARQRLGAEQR